MKGTHQLFILICSMLSQWVVPIESLQCYECAKLKGRADTCNDNERTIINSTSEDGVRCRVFTFGGVVVGQGMVSDVLCSPESLMRSQLVISNAFIGSGSTLARCCNISLCNGEEADSSSIDPPTMNNNTNAGTEPEKTNNGDTDPNRNSTNTTTATESPSSMNSTASQVANLEKNEQLDIAARLSKNEDETPAASEPEAEGLESEAPRRTISSWLIVFLAGAEIVLNSRLIL